MDTKPSVVGWFVATVIKMLIRSVGKSSKPSSFIKFGFPKPTHTQGQQNLGAGIDVADALINEGREFNGLRGHRHLKICETCLLVWISQVLAPSLERMQLVYMRRRSAKERLLTNLARVQQEVDAGLRVEFAVDKSLMGLIVGTQGANIRKVRPPTYAILHVPHAFCWPSWSEIQSRTRLSWRVC